MAITSIEKVAAEEPLKSAGEPNYPPFSMMGNNGEAIGFSIDLLNATIKAIGREIDFKVDSWPTINQELADNKLDVLPLVGRTPERESTFDFTIPYLTLHGMIVVRKDNHTIQSAKDLEGENVGVMSGDVAEEYMLREKFADKLITTKNFEITLQQLNTGNLDAVVVQTLVALQLINKLRLDDLEMRGKLDSFRQEWSFAVTEGDKRLLADFNEGLSIVIADGTYDQLRQKWLGIPEPDHTKEHIYTIVITALTVMLVALLIARLWQGSLRSQVKKSTAELEIFKNNLEALVTTRAEELEAEQYKLNQAQEISHIGSYRWDTGEDKTTWSDELFRITGYEPQAFEPTYEKYVDCIHPEDRENFTSLTQQVLKDKGPYSAEYRLLLPDGKVRHVLEKGEVKLGDENNLSLLVGVIHDVTERKQAWELAENLKQLQHEKSATEQLMQAIMDNTPAVIYVKDINGYFTFANQQFLTLFHLQRDNVIGRKLHDIFPAEIADEMLSNDLEVLAAKKPLKSEESAPQDDGLHHYLSIKFPLWNDGGEVYAVGGVSTDITDRFLIEESLRISQQRLLLHREQSPVGVIEWNTDFEFLDWNPAAEKIFGFTKDEVTGKHITTRILPESARPAVNKVWADLLANKGGFYSLNENTTKDGRTILCEWHNTPLVDHDGKVIGVTSLVDDVTQRQKNEEDLRHSQKMDAIGKLTGGIAHDFNNMLSVILGFSRLLKDRVNDGDLKQIKYCDEILSAGERAKKLTSKLLEFSRKAPSSAETTHINKLLRGMQHMLEKTLTPRIKLVLDMEENLWTVWIDKTRLEDAILNISINSMHAMPDGGTLTMSSSNIHLAESDIHNIDITPGDYVLLSVSDTGIGMSWEVKEKMFDPFFTTKGDGGTGLGMSQVYGFVQQSGGNIQVYSEPGHGTRIALYIPRHQGSGVDKSERGIKDSMELASGEETILVVDDEVALLELTKEILTIYGYTVLCAESAEQALEVLNSKSVDLLLSDVIMPGMDGYQLATEVEKRYPKIKIQMASGFIDDRKINLANETLHQQRLHKPFSPKELLRRIRHLLDEEEIT